MHGTGVGGLLSSLRRSRFCFVWPSFARICSAGLRMNGPCDVMRGRWVCRCRLCSRGLRVSRPFYRAGADRPGAASSDTSVPINCLWSFSPSKIRQRQRASNRRASLHLAHKRTSRNRVTPSAAIEKREKLHRIWREFSLFSRAKLIRVAAGWRFSRVFTAPIHAGLVCPEGLALLLNAVDSFFVHNMSTTRNSFFCFAVSAWCCFVQSYVPF